MRKLLPFALVLGAACGGAASTSPTTPQPGGGGPAGGPGNAIVTGRPVIPADWALATRAKAVTGSHALVVSGHPLARQVRVAMLRPGGQSASAAVSSRLRTTGG